MQSSDSANFRFKLRLKTHWKRNLKNVSYLFNSSHRCRLHHQTSFFSPCSLSYLWFFVSRPFHIPTMWHKVATSFWQLQSKLKQNKKKLEETFMSHKKLFKCTHKFMEIRLRFRNELNLDFTWKIEACSIWFRL